MNPLEVSANAVTAVSIWLAARNSPHTWTTGVVGCILFGVLFFSEQLYADASLQLFFIATCVFGWRNWRHRTHVLDRPITRAAPSLLVWLAAGAALVTLVYGGLLHCYTDAYLPFVDASVLALSVVAQCLLMQRKLESWPWWLAVNTVSVPLFASRGLWLTAALYACYWCNAWYGWWRWRREVSAGFAARPEASQ